MANIYGDSGNDTLSGSEGESDALFGLAGNDTLVGEPASISIVGIKLVSAAADGTQGNGDSYNPSISSDGRYIAFQSSASNLVGDDTNGTTDVFVRDLLTDTITRASTTADGAQVDFGGMYPALSADGRYLAFASFDSPFSSNNLMPADNNVQWDIFVKDLVSGAVTLVSTATDGTQGNGASFSNVAISADGRYVVFESDASNLVPGDTNGKADLFVKDLTSGETFRVSTASDGSQVTDPSRYQQPFEPSISADGRYVAFQSAAPDLVAGDTNNEIDVFVKDLVTGTTTRVSTATNGGQGDRGGYLPTISADGRYAHFESDSDNLIQGFHDVFIKDLQTGTLTAAYTYADGSSPSGHITTGVGMASLSPDGHYVCFASGDLVFFPGDDNHNLDLFVKNVVTGELVRITDSPEFGNSIFYPLISTDAKVVVFMGNDSAIPGDDNGYLDIAVLTPFASDAGDTLTGGPGDDVYVLHGSDAVVEAAGEGTDTVQTDLATYTLPANVEQLVYTGSQAIDAKGNALDNTLHGGAGKDTLNGDAGNDLLDGGAGIDTVEASSFRSQYTLSNISGGFQLQDNVSGRDGTDTLVNIERLQFADRNLALDLAPSDNAGQALLFIGVLAHDLIASPEIVGMILGYFDGGMNMQQLNQLAVDVGLVSSLAGGGSNADVARLAYQNVIGAAATTDAVDFLVSFMDGRNASFSQSEFLTAVANLDVNQTHVDLVGLAQTGVEYLMG